MSTTAAAANVHAASSKPLTPEQAVERTLTKLRYIFAVIAVVALVVTVLVLVVRSISSSAPLVGIIAPVQALVTQFALAFTHNDVADGQSLFTSRGTASLHTLFVELSAGNQSVQSEQYESHMAVLFGTYLSTFMTLSNVDVTLVNNTFATAMAVGYVQRTVDTVVAAHQTHVSYAYSFSMYFEATWNKSMRIWQLQHVQSLANATKIDLDNVSFRVGAPEGPILQKKRGKSVALRDLESDQALWFALQTQINNLVARNQKQDARYLCATPFYLSLKDIFDAQSTDTTLYCNTPDSTAPAQFVLSQTQVCIGDGRIDASCFGNMSEACVATIACVAGTDLAERIKTINSINPASPSLDFTITGGPGIQVEGGANGITITNDLKDTLILPPELFFDGYYYLKKTNQTANTVWAGPVDGTTPAPPTFRALVPADLPPLNITYTLELSAALSSEFSLSGSPFTGSSGTITLSKAVQPASAFWAGPVTGAAAEPTFRTLAASDLAALGLTDGQLVIGSTGGTPVMATLVAGANVVITNMPGEIIISTSVNGSAIGTVMSVGLDLPASVFAVSGSPVTSMGTLAGSFVAQAINTVFAGPAGGASAVPTFRSLGFPDLPPMTSMQVWMGDGANTITAGSGLSITFGAGSTTFTVTLVMPVSIFSVTSDVNGPTTVTLASQSANTFLAAPSGAAGVPSFRTFTADDLTSLGMTDGQLVIGSTGGTPVLATLVAGANVVITNMPGEITISTSINGSAIGTVMSVGLDLPASVFSISNSPVTSMGTLTGAFVAQAINKVFAGPVGGVAGVPTFRALGFPDLPPMTSVQVWMGDGANTITAGAGLSITFGTGLTTFTVTLVMPVSIFSVASDVDGPTTVTLVSQSANTFLAAPSGSAGVPSFRTMTLADLPGTLGNGQLYIGNAGAAVVSSLTAGTRITITPGPGTLTVSTTAQANTASNVGVGAVGGVGIFKQKTGEDLEFYGINKASNKVSIALNVATNEIDLDVVPANIDHDALSNYVSNQHVDHSAVSIMPGTGLTGGGDLTTTRTLALTDTGVVPDTYGSSTMTPVITIDAQGRITNATNVLMVDVTGEANTASNVNTDGVGVFKQKTGVDLEFRGISAGSNKTVIVLDTLNNAISVDMVPSNVNHNALSNYVYSEHIDHSMVNIVPGTGLTGGGDLTATRTLNLADTTVVADTYGSSTMVPVITIDAQGRITNATNVLVMDVTGESNSASNVNVGGVGVFKQKAGIDLEFRGIIAGSTKTSVTLDAPNNVISVDVVTGNIDHDALSNYVSNQHIDHSAVSITPGTGLTGGGDLTATRTLNLADTAVVADTYGSSTRIPVITIDAQGRITNASNVLMVDLTGESNTATNINVGGVGVFEQKAGTNLEFRGIIAGSSKINVTLDAPNYVISVDVVTENIDHDALSNHVSNQHIDHTAVSITPGTGLTGGGDLTTTRTLNLADTAVVPDTYGSTTMIPVITIDAQGRITNASNVLMVDITGESNTASNVNVGGVGVFKQKTGVDLEFRGIRADSNKTTVTLDMANNAISIDVVPSNMDHNALLNFVANKHIDHSAVSIMPGTGLTGGGDLTATRTLDLADTTVVADTYGSSIMVPVITIDAQGRITNATNVLMLDAAGESNTASNVNVGGVGVFKQKTGVDLEFHGISAGSNKTSVTLDTPNNAISVDVVTSNIDHNALFNYASAEHVDHTTVSITAGTGLTGGGTIAATRTLTLADTTVTPATYGSSTMIPVIAIDQQGRITSASNVAMVDVTGESNTASNVNVGGVGVFKQKTGVDLEFRGVIAGSTKTSVILDTPNNTISVDVVTENIDHDALSNYVSNQHIDHSAVSIVPGTGLTGGGDLTATRTLNLADTDVVADTYGSSTRIPVITIDAQGRITNASNVLMVDLTGESNTATNINVGGVGVFEQKAGTNLEFRGIIAGSTKASVTLDAPNYVISVDVVPANIDHDALMNYVSNQHIDHSAVSIIAGTGLTGGGDLTTTRTLDLADTTVVADTYGSSTMVPVITVDAQGRLTNVTLISIGGGAGEANTASNVNTAGVGMFKQKTSIDLEFRGISAGSSKASVTLDTPNNAISVDVVPANIDHDALLNYVANQHIDHSAVSISPGTGLTGGGTIAATRTLTLADTAVTPATYGSATMIPVITIDQQGRITLASDVAVVGGSGGETNTASNVNVGGVGVFKQKTGVDLEFRGIIGGSNKTSVTLDATNNVISVDVVTSNIDHNALFNYASAEHVDHTAVSITAGTGLTGGGTIAATRTLTLADTAVTPATYGSATLVPVLTIDQQGRITGASTTAVTSTFGALTIDSYASPTPTTACVVAGGVTLATENPIILTRSFSSVGTWNFETNAEVSLGSDAWPYGGINRMFFSPNGTLYALGCADANFFCTRGLLLLDASTLQTQSVVCTISTLAGTAKTAGMAFLNDTHVYIASDIDSALYLLNINDCSSASVYAGITTGASATTLMTVYRTRLYIATFRSSATQPPATILAYDTASNTIVNTLVNSAQQGSPATGLYTYCSPNGPTLMIGSTYVTTNGQLFGICQFDERTGAPYKCRTTPSGAFTSYCPTPAALVSKSTCFHGDIDMTDQYSIININAARAKLVEADTLVANTISGNQTTSAIMMRTNRLILVTADSVTGYLQLGQSANLYSPSAGVLQTNVTAFRIYAAVSSFVSTVTSLDVQPQITATVSSTVTSIAASNAIASVLAGTYSSMIGVSARAVTATAAATSTVTLATAFQVLWNVYGAGPITIVTQIGLDVPTTSGLCTNAYGIRLGAPTGGTAINNALNFLAGTTPAAGITFGADALPQANLYRSASQVLECDATLSSVYKLSLLGAVASAIGSKAGVAVISNTVAGSTITSAVAYQATPFSAAGMSAATIVTTATGFQVVNNALGTGPAVIGTQIGLDVPALTVASTNAYGVRLAAPTGGTAINNALNFVAATTPAGGITFGADALPQANLYRSAAQVLETDATLSSVYKLSLNGAVASAVASKAGVSVISNTVGSSALTAVVAYQATPFSAAGMTATPTVTTATAFKVVDSNLGSGPAVLTTHIGLDVPALAASATNAYGARLAAPTGGSAINNALNFVSNTVPAGGITFGADALPQANLYRSASQVLECDATLSSVYKLSLNGAVTNAIGSKAGVAVISNVVAGSTITNAVSYQATPFSASGMSAATIVTTATGFQVANNVLGTGPAVVGTQIGLDVPALTVASTNAYGVRLAAPTGGSAINNALNFVASTTPAGGITFGADAAPSVNLYRSAANMLQTDGDLTVRHVVPTSSSIPTVATGTGAGTTGPASSATVTAGSTDCKMQVTVSTGNSCSASAPIITVTYNSAFTGTVVPGIVFSPANAAAAARSSTGSVFIGDETLTTFTLTSGTAGLANGATYKWNFQVCS